MSKKRTSLDSIMPASKKTSPLVTARRAQQAPQPENPKAVGKRPHVKQQALYLKHPVYKQLRALAFEEEKKMHDLCLEALDLLFAERGVRSIAELQSD